MSYISEFNWVLKLKPEQGLDEENLQVGEMYNYFKEGARNYPLKYPIILVNNDWEAIASVEILSFIANLESTKGQYKVIKIYQGIDKEVLTTFLQDNIRYYKEDKTTEFSKLKAT